jgi:hypothetical protein
MKQNKIKAGSKNVPVETTPLSVGGANFRDKTLQQLDERRLSIKPSVATRVMGIAFLIVGLVPSAFSVYRLLRDRHQTEYWVLLGFGMIFFTAGLLVLVLSRRFDFDLDEGQMAFRRFWPRRTRPLAQILAVQVIHGGWHTAKTKGGGQITYCTYQLNLVLDDPQQPRMNLSNHSDWDWTWQSGNTLAEFLEIPFLDSVSEVE